VTKDETVIDEVEELDIDEDLKEELRSVAEMKEVKKVSELRIGRKPH
jgi:hypothetical protein